MFQMAIDGYSTKEVVVEDSANSPQPISRRQMLKLMSSGAVAAALAACGSPTSTTTGGATTESPATIASKSKVVLWTGYGQGAMADAMTEAINRYNTTSDKYEVEHVIIPWQELITKATTAIAGGNPPDVLRNWAFTMADLAFQGALIDLTPYAEATPDFNFEDFWPSSQAQMKMRNGLYGLNISTTPNLFFYNKQRLREGGFDPEQVPQTLEEWEEIGHALTISDGKTIERIGFVPWIPAYSPFTWAAAFDAPLWDEANGKILANNPKMVEVLKWHQTYADRYNAQELQAWMSSYSGNQYGRNTPEGVYYTGLLSLWVVNSWLIGGMREYGKDVDYGIAPVPMPSGSSGKNGTTLDNTYSVPKGAKNPEGAFDFCKFITSDVQVAINKVLLDGAVPCRQSLARHPEVQASPLATGWLSYLVDEVMPNLMARPSMPLQGTYETKLNTVIENVIFSGADPEATLAETATWMQGEIDKVLAK